MCVCARTLVQLLLVCLFGTIRTMMNPIKCSSSNLLAIVVSVLVLSGLIDDVHSELTPPYFNLAEGRNITATATCGVGTDGPELYCKLVGANTEHDNNQHKYELIQGQVRTTQITSFSSSLKHISSKLTPK